MRLNKGGIGDLLAEVLNLAAKFTSKKPSKDHWLLQDRAVVNCRFGKTGCLETPSHASAEWQHLVLPTAFNCESQCHVKTSCPKWRKLLEFRLLHRDTVLWFLTAVKAAALNFPTWFIPIWLRCKTVITAFSYLRTRSTLYRVDYIPVSKVFTWPKQRIFTMKSSHSL